ncbi:MAG: J domain-containing protein [Treponema sp.]|nr:J domain-containing protein [Treponema sp.]
MELRIILGPLIGGLVGLIGGLPGLIIGMILGYLIQELIGQFTNNRRVRQYYGNPGASRFYECEPGLAAFCALGILIIAKSSKGQINAEVAAEEAGRKAKMCFPAAASDPAMPAIIDQFCREAWLQRKTLNRDLLIESLISRRRRAKDADLSGLGPALYNLASTDEARSFAQEIWHMIDPQSGPEPLSIHSKDDPWKILDISPMSPLPEVKVHYRMLAAQFHPDAMQGLDEEHRKTAAKAFIAIQKAYSEITGREKQ